MSYKLDPEKEVWVQNNAPNWAKVYNPVAGGVYFGGAGGKIGYSHCDRIDIKFETYPVNSLTEEQYESWLHHSQSVRIVPPIQANE